MCYFITIGVPTKHYELVREKLSKNYEIQRTDNPSFCEQLGPDGSVYTITKDGCSCSLYNWIDLPEWNKTEKNKRRKKGWSEAKINRSIEQMIKNSQFGVHEGLIREISSILQKIKILTFTVHWYDDDVEKEVIYFSEKSNLSIGDLINKPTEIRPDVFYRILL